MEARCVDSATAAELLGVSERAIRKRIAKGDLEAGKMTGRDGGAAYAISLPVVLSRASTERKMQFFESQSTAAVNVTDADLATYRETYGEAGIEQLAKRQQAVMALDGILSARLPGKGKAVEELAEAVGVASRTLRRWHEAYMQGGLAAIMDKIDRKDKGKPKAMCQMACDLVERDMCDDRKFPQALILERLQGIAKEYGDCACDSCPYCEWSDVRKDIKPQELAEYAICEQATGRMVVPENRYPINRFAKTISPQQLEYARYGKRSWEAMYMHKTRRAKPDKVNECWFGDHHKLDLFVQDENGRIVRPWLTAWMDAYSGVFVGWALTLEPNSDTVADSFARAAVYTVGSEVVGLPSIIYIDNGKDYRSTRFEGGQLSSEALGRLNYDFCDKSILQSLNVKVIHAKPYRGWSKNIERAFGTLERWIREFPGWCGDSPDERPEDLGRTLRKLSESGKLMTFETFAKCFVERVLPQYNSFVGADGVSPMELYLQGEKARTDVPDWATMAMLKSMREKRVISTQGIRYDSQIYWHPTMAEHVREQATILINRGYNPSITVMVNDRFVCEAEPLDTMGLIDETPERIAAHMAAQKGQQRMVTDRIAKVRQATKRVAREMYAEAIDEQRGKWANVISLDARRIETSKTKIDERRSGRKSKASEGEDKVRNMMIANGAALLKKGAR